MTAEESAYGYILYASLCMKWRGLQENMQDPIQPVLSQISSMCQLKENNPDLFVGAAEFKVECGGGKK